MSPEKFERRVAIRKQKLRKLMFRVNDDPNLKGATASAIDILVNRLARLEVAFETRES